MIKIDIICVGSLKERFLKEGCEEYLKRLKSYAKVNVVELNEYKCSQNPSENEILQVIQKEGERIIAKIPKNSYVIPMCIEGQMLSSEEFSKKIENIAVDGNCQITFIIGGSFGLSKDVKNLGNFKMSFGKLTLPHQLMRVVLLEQIYRAFSIANNSKYHK